MNKVIFLLILNCVFALAQYNGEVVDNRSASSIKQNGEIFGDTIGDGSKVWKPTGYTCDKPADCSSIFVQEIQKLTQNTSSELSELNKQWKQTNKELDRILQITKELPIAQQKALALEEVKLMKLKETNFNLQKALKIDPPKAEILQEKQGLGNDFLSK